LSFRITNLAQSFLTNVQVIMTFHSVAGVDFEDPEDFEWGRFKDPYREPPAGPARRHNGDDMQAAVDEAKD